MFKSCICPPLKADPDIAGIGVIFSFLFSAAFTLLASIGYFLLEPRVKQRHLNPFDEFFAERVCIPFQRRFKDPIGLSNAFFRVVLAFGDQQLVTGIAILVAGFVMLAKNSITVYHFSIVLDMAWFSSNCHLLCIIIIARQLDSEAYGSKRAKPESRIPLSFVMAWRVAFMVFMCIWLIAANWPSGYRDWDSVFDCSAKCIPWDYSEMDGTPRRWLIFTELTLVFSYSIAIIRVTGFGERRLAALRDWVTKSDSHVRARLRALPFTLRIYGFLRLFAVGIWFAFWSNFLDLVYYALWFGLGCFFTDSDRTGGQILMSNHEKAREAETGFGQLIPIFFFVLPVIAFTEAYNDHRKQPALKRNDTEPNTALAPIPKASDQAESENDETESALELGSTQQDQNNSESNMSAHDDITPLLRTGAISSLEYSGEPNAPSPEDLRRRRIKTFPVSL
jgi:hypothetical protein